MRYIRKPTNFTFIEEWDGSAGTANSFIGERYGMDWEYLKDSCDIIVYPESESKYPYPFKVKVGEFLAKNTTKNSKNEDDFTAVSKLTKEDLTEYVEFK